MFPGGSVFKYSTQFILVPIFGKGHHCSEYQVVVQYGFDLHFLNSFSFLFILCFLVLWFELSSWDNLGHCTPANGFSKAWSLLTYLTRAMSIQLLLSFKRIIYLKFLRLAFLRIYSRYKYIFRFTSFPLCVSSVHFADGGSLHNTFSFNEEQFILFF